MTEPAYSEEDLRRAQDNITPFDAGLLNDYGGGKVEWWWDYIRALLADAESHYKEQCAAEFAKLRRERDEVADNLAEALRKTIGWALLANDNDPWYFSEEREPDFEPDIESAKAALTAYERSRA